MTVKKSQAEATKRYDKKAYDKILIRLRKGKKQEIQEHIAITGETMNGFITRAIDEKLRDSN